MSGNEMREVTFIYVHDTPEALCVHEPGENKDIWLPKSTIEIEGNYIDYVKGEEITFEAAEWILVKNELDYAIDN